MIMRLTSRQILITLFCVFIALSSPSFAFADESDVASAGGDASSDMVVLDDDSSTESLEDFSADDDLPDGDSDLVGAVSDFDSSLFEYLDSFECSLDKVTRYLESLVSEDDVESEVVDGNGSFSDLVENFSSLEQTLSVLGVLIIVCLCILIGCVVGLGFFLTFRRAA